jgi:hypothetical protein
VVSNSSDGCDCEVDSLALSPPARTIAHITTLDAQARADIARRPWWAVRRIVEQLAQSPQRPVTDHSDHEVGLTFLADQRGPLNRPHESRVASASTYLDCLASGSPTGPMGRWKRYFPATPVSELVAPQWRACRFPKPSRCAGDLT